MQGEEEDFEKQVNLHFLDPIMFDRYNCIRDIFRRD